MNATTPNPPAHMVEISQQGFFNQLRADARDIMPNSCEGGVSHWMDQKRRDGLLLGWSCEGRYFIPGASA